MAGMKLLGVVIMDDGPMPVVEIVLFSKVVPVSLMKRPVAAIPVMTWSFPPLMFIGFIVTAPGWLVGEHRAGRQQHPGDDKSRRVTCFQRFVLHDFSPDKKVNIRLPT
jgi:hypothetical protein